MLRQKQLVISLALAGLIASTDTSALGLGRLNVATALGQPLVAEVDLSVAPGDDFDSIRANIAPPSVYASARVEYQGVLQNIRVQALRRANGQPFLRLTSAQAINEPYLDVLVEVNSNTGRLVREFVVLLDPQGTAQPQSIEATANPRATITAPTPAAPIAASAPTPSPSAAAPAPRLPRSPAPAPAAAPSSASGGGYTVKSGDTLYSIASKNNPGVSIEQLMIAIQRANPGAFIGGNINRLRSGASLNLPSASEASAIATTEAVSEVRAQTTSWRTYVSRVSEGVPTVASDGPQARTSGRVSGSVSDSAGTAPSSDKLKLSTGERSKAAAKEDKVAATKALKEEQSRATELEKTKQNLEKALSLKSQTLADAQAKAKESTKKAPEPAVAVAAPAPTPAPAPAPAIAPPSAPPAPAPAPVAATTPPAPAPVEPPAPAPTPAPAPAPVEPPAAAPVAPPPSVAPPPPVAKKAAPEPVADDGIMGFVNENLPLVGGGLAVVLAGLGGLAWSRRRSAAKSLAADSKMSEPVVNTVNPDTVFGTSGLGVVKTNDAPIASQFSRSGMGTIDAGEVDPVAEAEVYIAYGREAQAEEILREALVRDPQRADVATKLAEMAAAQGNREGFDKWAGEVAKMETGADYAGKIAEYAGTHFPGHNLASGASAVASKAASAVQSAAQDAADMAKSAASGIGAAGAATAAVGVGAVAAAATAAKDFFSPAPTPAVAPNAPVFGASAAEKPGLDFVLDGMTVSASPATISKGMTGSKLNADTVSAKKKSLEDDLADLEASLKKATTTGQLPESSMDFTDFSTATPTNLGTVGPAMRPEMLDLSFDAARQGTVDPTPSILDGQWHDAATKLDLARAYEEMGDQEGAREILREVIHDGDESQKTEARALLAKLGG